LRALSTFGGAARSPPAAAACLLGDCGTAEVHIKNLQVAVWRRTCLYSVVAGRRIVGDVELNSPSEPEYVL